jgi:hypothetical protein
MSVKKTQVEAANTNRVTLVAEAPGRKKLYLHNDTTKTLNVSLGADGAANANLPSADTTFKSFAIPAGVTYEVVTGFDDAVVGFFSAADAGKFVRITEVF